MASGPESSQEDGTRQSPSLAFKEVRCMRWRAPVASVEYERTV